MIVWAVGDFAFFLPDTYYSLYVESLGASAFFLGTILSASSFVMAFLQLAGGYWADKHGRKLLIVGMNFGKSLIFLIFATAPTWHFVLVGEVLLGISTISQPALTAILADSLPPDKRGLGYSLTMAVGATSIVSPVVAGFLYLNYNLVNGMRIAYAIVSGCWFATGLVLMKLTETLPHGSLKISIKDVIKHYPNAVRQCVTVWKLVPKPMLNLLLVFTPSMFFVRMCLPYYVLYANHVLQIEEFHWALLQIWHSTVFYISLLPIGRLIDIFGRKKPLMLSSLFFAAGIALFLHGTIVDLYLFFALSAVGNAMIFTAYPSLQADLTPAEYRGKIMGFTNFLDCILGSGALLLSGLLYENISPTTPFLLQLIVMAITAMTTFLFIKEKQDE